jgi:hypothetical protein
LPWRAVRHACREARSHDIAEKSRDRKINLAIGVMTITGGGLILDGWPGVLVGAASFMGLYGPPTWNAEKDRRESLRRFRLGPFTPRHLDECQFKS